MYPRGHYGVSMLVYAPIAFGLLHINHVLPAFVGLLIVLGLASLPDADHNLPFVKHRGITHTVWFAILVGIFLGGVGYYFLSYLSTSLKYTPLYGGVFGFCMGFLGIVAHILGDVITPMGIRPFGPVYRKKYSLSLVLAKNTWANLGLLLLGIIATSVSFGVHFMDFGTVS